MAAEQEAAGASAQAQTTTTTSLLDQAISATRQTEPEQAQLLLKTLTEEALKGTVTFSRNLTVTFNKAVELLDKKLSDQVAAIMNHPDFLKLEGSWRGLSYLVSNTITDSMLKIKLLNAPKADVAKDLAKATDFDQSDTFKRIYTSEFGTLGGERFCDRCADEGVGIPIGVSIFGLFALVFSHRMRSHEHQPVVAGKTQCEFDISLS